ncbi:MAG: flagellar basal body rod protein FlgC [Planctomycetota bacterium]
MLSSIDISTSGLVAQRRRLDTVSANIANAQTTRDADGNAAPYQRRLVQFQAAQVSRGSAGQGVTARVEIDESTPPRRLHQPGHPDADADGYVSLPSIDLVTEFVNAVEASRAYEANVVAIEMSREMARTGLRLIG